MGKRMLFLFFWLCIAAVAPGSVDLYNPPPASALVKPSDYFNVTVDGRNSFVYQFEGTRWRDLEATNDTFYESITYFGFTNQTPVVEVTSSKPIESLKILPRSAKVTWTQITDKIFRFSLSKPQKLYIEVNGDELRPLMLFADYTQKYPVNPGGKVKYFAGGMVYTPTNSAYISSDGLVDLVSGDEVYVAGGAVLNAHFDEISVTNITIHGPGIIFSTAGKRGVRFKSCAGITLKDYIMVKGPDWMHYLLLSTNIVADNVKAFGLGPVYTDGWDLFSCINFRLSNLFIKTEDDCISIKTSKWTFDGPCRDGIVSNCIFWNGGPGGPISFSEIGNIAEDIHFNNLEILQSRRRVDKNGRAPVSMRVEDGGIVRNVSFTDMSIEDISENFLWMRTGVKSKYMRCGLVENIDFRRISYNREPSRRFDFIKLPGSKGFDRIRFDGLYTQGHAVNSLAEGGQKWTIENPDNLMFTPCFSNQYQLKNGASEQFVRLAGSTQANVFDFIPLTDLPGHHYIRNPITGNFLTPDETGDGVAEKAFSGAETQQWEILPAGKAPGFYCIKSKATGRQLFSDSVEGLKARYPQGSSDEQWQLSLAHVVRLKNKASGNYLSGIDLYGNQTGGNIATVKALNGKTEQLWQRVYFNTTNFYLRNIQTKLMLWGKNPYGQSASGCAVSCQYDFQWSSEQWKTVDNGDGSFGIQNADSGLYLSADSTDKVTPAIFSDLSAADNARWIIEAVTDQW